MKIGLVSAHAGETATVRRILRTDQDYEIIWVAHTAAEAIERCRAQTPVILLLSIGGSNSGSVDAVRHIMAESPCAILLLAASIHGQAGPIFEALGAGAVDVVHLTDANGREAGDAVAHLTAKLALLRRLGSKRAPGAGARKTETTAGKKPERLLVLGASAGGPSALATVLAGLPVDFPAPIAIVQHIDEQFASGMAEWLAQQCALPVKLAQNNERMETGVVYLAGGSDHLVLRDRYTFQYRAEPSNHAYRPSIDELFFSTARVWASDAVGVLLTGMGSDGAAGLRALRVAGALTITQDKDSSVVYGIPKAAARLNAAVMILPLTEIAKQIIAAVHTSPTQ